MNTMIALQERDERIIQLERTCHEYEYRNQKVQTEKESERQVFDEKLQQIERAAKENYARHQQPERRSWIVQRHEVEVDQNEILGRGSWGTVFKGWFRGAPVAVKELHRIIISDHNRILFHREMELASRLRHKNLVQFMAAVAEGGDPLIVTEFANGGSLAKIIQQRTLPFAEVLSVAFDAGQGILYLHSADVYSFGLVVLEMSIGELPVPQQHSRQLEKVVDDFLRRLIRECIQPNPDERPDMQRVVAELRQRKADIVAIN